MVPMRMLRTVAIPLLVAAAVLPACSSSKKASSSSAATASSGTAITIKNFAFSPTPMKVAPGATVTVKNGDGTTHTLTADDKTSFDIGRTDSGASKTFTAPTKAGSYSYHCAIHDYMKATLVVS